MKFKDSLTKKLKEKEAHVAILGLGYVGLPLAVVFGEIWAFRWVANRMPVFRESPAWVKHLDEEERPVPDGIVAGVGNKAAALQSVKIKE